MEGLRMRRSPVIAICIFNMIFFIGTIHFGDHLARNYWLGLPASLVLLGFAVAYLRARLLIATLADDMRFYSFCGNFVFGQSLLNKILMHSLSFWGYGMSILWMLVSFAIVFHLFRKMIGFDWLKRIFGFARRTGKSRGTP